MKKNKFLEKIFDTLKNKDFFIADENKKYNSAEIKFLLNKKIKFLSKKKIKGNTIAVLKNNCGAEYWINLLVALRLNFTIFPEVKKSKIYNFYNNVIYFNGNKIFLKKNKKVKKNNITKSFDLIFSSSGSTGEPKLILQKLLFVVKNTEFVLKKIKFKKNKIFFMCIPYLFTSAICHFFACMISGTKFYSTEKIMLPSNIVNFIKIKRINYFGGPPLHSGWIINSNKKKFKNFEKLISSGDFVSEEIINLYLKKKLRFNFYYMYGLSEVGGRFCINEVKNNKFKFFVGKPLRYMKILNKNNQRGEIIVKSKNLFLGYYQKNQFILHKGNLYHSGDIGVLKKDNLMLDGRVSEIFKSSGVMIYPQLIKRKLVESKWFKEIFIYKGFIKSFGNVPFCAFVGKKKIHFGKINDYLKTKVPNSHLPKKYFELKKFPRLGNNKIDKQFIINNYQ